MDSFETRGPSDSVGGEIPFPSPHLPRHHGYLQPAFTLPQGIFRPLALHKLSELRTDIPGHFQEILIRFFNLMTETFHDPDDFIAEFDRKADAGVQALFSCRGRSWKITVIGYVRNPLRFATAPDSPRQTHAGRKLALAGDRLELSYVNGGKTPKVDAGQLVGRSIHFPYRSPAPTLPFHT